MKMQKNTTWFLIVLVAGVSAYFATAKTEKAPAREVAVESAKVEHAPHAHVHAAAPVAPAIASRAPAAAAAGAAASSTELRSLNEMAETVAAATQEGGTLKSLVERLQKTGQAPRITRDANPYSGEMIIVRADSPLEGTRYFHAQYFVGEDGLPFVQHMSFEFKPGPNAMNDALAAVSKNFPGLAAPTHQREGYARWKLNENQILWAKVLNEDDVKNDPFNAYSKKDLGAVRVAVEAEIHD